jgi:hypothetical protein
MMANFFYVVREALEMNAQKWRWRINGHDVLAVAVFFAFGAEPLEQLNQIQHQLTCKTRAKKDILQT